MTADVRVGMEGGRVEKSQHSGAGRSDQEDEMGMKLGTLLWCNYLMQNGRLDAIRPERESDLCFSGRSALTRWR